MLTLKELRERRGKVLEDMNAVISLAEEDGRAVLSQEEQSEYDELQAQFEKLGESIERKEKLEAFQSDLKQSAGSISRQVRVVHPGGDPAPELFKDKAEFLGAVFQARLGKKVDQRLEYFSDQEMGTGSSGGFAIPTQFDSNVRQMNQADYVLKPYCSVISGGENPDAEFEFPALDQSSSNKYGGVSLTWQDQELDADMPETSASLRMVKLKPKSLVATIPVTNKLMNNWSGAGAFYSRLMDKARIHGEEVSFLSGQGTGLPMGLLAAGTGGRLDINRATATTIALADLIALEAACDGDEANKRWMISRRAYGHLRTMESTSGFPMFGQSAGDGAPATLLGRPYFINPRGPALGALGDIVLGDFSAYIVKEGSGPFVDLSEHVEFKRNRTMLRVVSNVDGLLMNEAALKAEDGSSVSPIVALDVPSGG